MDELIKIVYWILLIVAATFIASITLLVCRFMDVVKDIESEKLVDDERT